MVPSVTSEEMNGANANGQPKSLPPVAVASPLSTQLPPPPSSSSPTMAAAMNVDAEVNVGPVEAIYVRNASKSYGVGKRRAQVLRNLDMNVKKGTIYGLLGASGCGKTTLLSCIVGRRSFDSGEVLVFGGEPGSPESGIPGPRVGYMPQELALYGEFSIKETLEYFGRIYRLPAAFVKQRMQFLFKLLDLPPGHRSVKTLSGGQQRRVSFAVSLFHEPELLILDEPTVGVDPLLRQNIWDHLCDLSNNQGRTIIITTHYIEEARQAHTVGLMRSGSLLAEESPLNLLAIHSLSTLEEVFLKLCMRDGLKKKRSAAAAASSANGGVGGGVAAVVSTIASEGKALNYPAIDDDEHDQGVDNPAFSHGVYGSAANRNVNAAADADDEDTVDANGDKNNKTMAMMPLNCQYWKNNKSILPVVEEDGIVGLTFSPSVENLVHSQRATKTAADRQRVNDLNAFNGGGGQKKGDDSKQQDNLFRGDKGGSTPASSNSSNAGDTTSSCGSTTDGASSRVSKKRRSRTFTLAVPSPHRTAALIRKNFMQTFRNIGMFLFIFLLPAAQAILFCLAIGRDPTFLKMAVVNEELDPSAGRVCNYTTDCTYSMFSCRFLRHVDNTTVVQIPYQSYSDALDAARRGDVWGVIHFPQNFTDELMVRQADGNSADNATITGSQIGVKLDWSNQQISLTIQRRMIDAFDAFTKDLLTACDYEANAGSLPLTFLDPIYGDKDPSFTEFMAPGLILTIVYFIAVALTAAVFINERKQGLLDRSLVAGVTTTEIMVAHLANQFTVLMGQTTLVFVFMLCVFDIPCHGNLGSAIFITLLQGLCGMSYGFLVSSLCDEETSAIHLALGSFYPNLLLSGVLWPMEGMPVYLRYVSYFLPQTYAVESLRNIFARAWGMDRPEVYWGVAISFGWIFGLLALSIAVIRVRKYTG